MIARPISAPYSSWAFRIDSGEPSKPDRFARMTRGRFPLAAFAARASFFDDCGKSVPAVHCSGPSVATKPTLGTGRDSIPTRQTGIPPSRASQTTATSASRIPCHRSSGSWS